jgi:N-acylneuraminate cytidylyltransferase
MSKTLFLIPARAGSKGLPQKNIKNLCGKPLISYSIEFALQNCNTNDIICISTNDLNVVDIAKKQYQIDVPFIRSEELSSDTASTFDVLIDALKYYEKHDCYFDKILLLQPTSPYRIQHDFEKINGGYVVYRSSDMKVMKSVNYFRPDLSKFFTEDELFDTFIRNRKE